MIRMRTELLGVEGVQRALDELARRLSDATPAWREILANWKSEQKRVFSTQGGSIGAHWPPLSPRYCVTVGTDVLTRDLRWVAADALGVGDELWSPSDEGHLDAAGHRWRYWETASVQATGIIRAECVRLVFDSDREVTSTLDHPWLAHLQSRRDPRLGRASKGNRRTTDALAWRLAGDIAVGDRFPVYVDSWTEDRSYEAGWLAALMDGEGHLSVRAGRGDIYGHGHTSRIGIAQKEGAVATRAREIMTLKGIKWSEHVQAPSGVVAFEMNGGSASTAKVLGSLRPVRLVPKWLGGALRAIRDEQVVAVERVGVREVVTLQTSSGTFFAAGLAAHNSEWKARHYGGRPMLVRSGSLRAAAEGEGSGFSAKISALALELGITHRIANIQNARRPIMRFSEIEQRRWYRLMQMYVERSASAAER